MPDSTPQVTPSTAMIDALADIQRGIEKEGLRVTSDGSISQAGHPEVLGSSLTHPSITTDYSESLLEFITPKQRGVEETIDYLSDLHSFTLRNLADEVVWPSSMPCAINGDESIPIALYGSSNVGQMKHVYRQGLGVRYGRIMQSISGIHYNLSFPDQFWLAHQKHLGDTQRLKDFKSEQYFSLIRNFRRYSWLLHYLFGASPVIDASFLAGHPHQLQSFSGNTLGLPYATSLRMSDLGYQNSAQEDLKVSYNTLNEYTQTLGKAVHQSYPAYEEIGTQRDGQYIQLNTNILQLENEYYSDIRPKRVTESGEKPIHALDDRGVEYIEVRILDINPFIAQGISSEQIRFLDGFLIHCLISQCPLQSLSTCSEIKTNQTNVIMRGRDPDLMMEQDAKQVPLKVAANQMLDCIGKAAAMLDQANQTKLYSAAVTAQRTKVADPSLTPSGRIMAMVESGEGFLEISKRLADQHKDYFKHIDNTQLSDSKMRQLAEQSLLEQAEMERNDVISFDQYLAAYNEAD
ncbi:MAG: glutamate--cysteine ligase [Arenicella sp.]